MLNFKIVDNGGCEYYITPRRKFPSMHALLEAYKTTPIKSKLKNSQIFLLHPIPVDTSVQQKHKQLLEVKGKIRKQFLCPSKLILDIL